MVFALKKPQDVLPRLGRFGVAGRLVASSRESSQFLLFDPTTHAAFVAEAPTAAMRSPTKLFGENCAEGVDMLRSLFAVTLSAVAAQAARRCLVTLLLAWPDDVMVTESTKSDNLLLLTKAIAASALFFETRAVCVFACGKRCHWCYLFLTKGERQFSLDERADAATVTSALVGGLRRKLSRLIQEELFPRDVMAFRWPCPGCTCMVWEWLLAAVCGNDCLCLCLCGA
jgi:hypothetical protein